MEFDDFLQQWVTQQVYPQVPQHSDTWQNYVFDHARALYAGQWKQALGRLEPITEQGKKIVEDIRLDVFGTGQNGQIVSRAADRKDASVARLIPSMSDTETDIVLETMHICAAHAAYKLFAWEARDDLRNLLNICSDIPPFMRSEYRNVFTILVGTIMNALSILHCDLETKQNYRRNPAVARLYKDLKEYGERMYDIIGGDSFFAQETDDEEWDDEDTYA